MPSHEYNAEQAVLNLACSGACLLEASSACEQQMPLGSRRPVPRGVLVCAGGSGTMGQGSVWKHLWEDAKTEAEFQARALAQARRTKEQAAKEAAGEPARESSGLRGRGACAFLSGGHRRRRAWRAARP